MTVVEEDLLPTVEAQNVELVDLYGPNTGPKMIFCAN